MEFKGGNKPGSLPITMSLYLTTAATAGRERPDDSILVEQLIDDLIRFKD